MAEILDEIDLQILKTLQKNAKLTTKESREGHETVSGIRAYQTWRHRHRGLHREHLRDGRGETELRHQSDLICGPDHIA